MSRNIRRPKKRALCIIDFCKNEGIHLFPKDVPRKEEWIQAIIYFKPRITLRKNSRICSAHFKSNDFIITLLTVSRPDIAPKFLKKTAVPSIFPWKSTSQEPLPTSVDQDSTPDIASSGCEYEDSLEINFPIQHTYAPNPSKLFVKEQPYWNTTCHRSDKDPLKCVENADSYPLELFKVDSSSFLSN